jgi:hypothetical protein
MREGGREVCGEGKGRRWQKERENIIQTLRLIQLSDGSSRAISTESLPGPLNSSPETGRSSDGGGA